MNRTKKKMKFWKLLLFILSIAAGIATFFFAFIFLKYTQNINKNISVEAGTTTISINDFITDKDVANKFLALTDFSHVNLSVPGKYPVDFRTKYLTVSGSVTVVDTTPPAATPKALSLLNGQSAKAEDFVTEVTDATAVTITFKSTPDFFKVGDQDVTIILTDTSGNHAEVVVPLHITQDTTPPQISGVKNISVFVGRTINYRKNVTVTDDHDPNPTLTVDSKEVDVSKEGQYTVTYIATDFAGNVQKKNAMVFVTTQASNDEEKREAAVKMADTVIASIINDSMTTLQKVDAVYNWAQRNIGYSGSSNKSDYKLEAYNAFKNHSGDCFTYFAATKMIFDRLNIPNIDVVKVKNYANDSNHFWSLVSIDGGANYYHFDATPRKGTGDEFCLVTDAFLDAYSNAHQKCHNRDMSLYPATPTQELR